MKNAICSVNKKGKNRIWMDLEWWEIFENANIEVKSQKETLAVEFEP